MDAFEMIVRCALGQGNQSPTRCPVCTRPKMVAYTLCVLCAIEARE